MARESFPSPEAARADVVVPLGESVEAVNNSYDKLLGDLGRVKAALDGAKEAYEEARTRGDRAGKERHAHMEIELGRYYLKLLGQLKETQRALDGLMEGWKLAREDAQKRYGVEFPKVTE
ncbi:hypothetical protein HYW18_00745 [Candidatus Uhrbacteria bacterium]|nr:hypothetical protein [Candidatus Uhrbacteria bacterium]